MGAAALLRPQQRPLQVAARRRRLDRHRHHRDVHARRAAARRPARSSPRTSWSRATGFHMQLPFGGIDFRVDGEPLDLPSRMAYKALMLSDVPNFFFTLGYTNASWTLKADLVIDYVCRLLAHMDQHGYQRARSGSRCLGRAAAADGCSAPATSSGPPTCSRARAIGPPGGWTRTTSRPEGHPARTHRRRSAALHIGADSTKAARYHYSWSHRSGRSCPGPRAPQTHAVRRAPRNRGPLPFPPPAGQHGETPTGRPPTTPHQGGRALRRELPRDHELRRPRRARRS